MIEVDRSEIIGTPRRVLVKIGSNVLTTRSGRVDARRIRQLAEQVSTLLDQGHEVIVVSSGAIATGLVELELDARPTTMPALQAIAAVGQGRLIRMYKQAFHRCGRRVGQVLLSREDMEDRARFLNTRNTLRALLDFGCVPIINENDTVCVDEIRYGDNDFLAAHLAAMVLADLVVLLTTVDGLMEADERGRQRVVSVVERISDDVLGLDDGGRSSRGTGGMTSKLRAASVVTRSGVPVVVANGKRRDVLVRIVGGEDVGTLFLPAARRMASRKRWIGFTAPAKGRLVVDEGAKRALVEGGKSLLASGICQVQGTFEQGDVVALEVEGGEPFAQGLTNYSSDELARIQGCHTRDIEARLGYKDYDEAVHRDNLVVFD
ncbi:glutamate 5-kinase [Planctomycetota bacterium]